MKRRNKILIIIAGFAFLLLLIGITVLSMNAKQSETVEKRITQYKDEQTVICSREDKRDDISETEEVYMQKGVLITRKNTATWSKSEPSEQTCTYYTTKKEGLSTKKGVTSSVECTEMRGSFSATYTIAEIDKEDIRLKQFDFIQGNNIFDVRSWTQYMKKEGYTCQ